MIHELHFPILQELGLSENEALIYELLLEFGTAKPRELTGRSGIGRGNVYNLLLQLKQQGLVLEIKGKTDSYQAVDPTKLRALLDVRLRESERLKSAFKNALPKLASAFTLSTGKPAIELFEGIAGVSHVLDDSLKATGEILTIVDPDAISNEVAAIELRYIKKRIARKLTKRIILPDTATARATRFTDDEYTKTRIVPGLYGGFGSAIEIYEDRFSLITLAGDRIISAIIQNKSITALQRAQFEALWNVASAPTPPSSAPSPSQDSPR